MHNKKPKTTVWAVLHNDRPFFKEILMKLSKRINAILDLCPALDTWADIGADHGLTSWGLLISKKANTVIAADISEGSLSKARALKEERRLSSMQLRIGDGFKAVLNDRADGAVISGMGTPLITDILEAEKEYAHSLKYMVLSPNNYSERMRKYLTENGYEIIKERMIEERGKYYPAMLIKRGEKRELGLLESYLGINTVKDEDYEKYLVYKSGVWEQIIKDTDGKNARALKMYGIYHEALISLRP